MHGGKSATPLRFGPSYEEQIRLHGGLDLVLRSIAPGDKPFFREGFDHLSTRSRLYRFFSPKPHLTESELAFFTQLDGIDHFAIGAVALERGRGGLEERHAAGVARCIRDREEPWVAEPAIVIVDEYQRQGLGFVLFVRLVAAAAERSVTHLRGELLAENVGMVALLKKIAPRLRLEYDGPILRFQLSLEEDLAPGLLDPRPARS